MSHSNSKIAVLITLVVLPFLMYFQCYSQCEKLFISPINQKLFHNRLEYPVLVMVQPCLQEKPDGAGCAVAGDWVLPECNPLYGHFTPPGADALIDFDTRLLAGVRWIVFAQTPSLNWVTRADIRFNFSTLPRKIYDGYYCDNLNGSSTFELKQQIDTSYRCQAEPVKAHIL